MKNNNLTQHYPKNQLKFINNITNSCDDVKNKQIIKHLGFVNPNELEIIKQICNKIPKVIVKIENGYFGAERKYITLLPFDYDKVASMIAICEVNYEQKHQKLEHRHLLGTLLNDGLNYLCNYLKEIAGVRVVFKKIEQVTITKKAVEEKKILISSNRIDNVVKALIKESRKNTHKLIKQKLVFLNYQVVLKPTEKIKVNDMLAIRKFGRVKIIKLEVTLKSKIRITYQK